MAGAPENPFAPRQYGRLEQVTDRVYIYRNIVNSSIFVGDDAIAVVDTQVNHALARRLLDQLQKTFNKPVRYAINTHYHWDHTNGNPVFKEAGATLVGNRVTADFMVSKAPRQKAFLASRGFELGPDPSLPDVFIEDQHSFELGNLRLECQRGHSAETDDPTLVIAAAEGVLTSGDTVMTGSFPIFGQPVQREGLENDQWLKALDEIRGFDAAHILPGHGPVAHAAELDTLERICRYFLEETSAAHQRGLSLMEAIRDIEARLPAWIAAIPEVWGTPRYAILRVWAGLEDLGEDGWQHVKPSAIPADEAAARKQAANCEDAAHYIDCAEQLKEGGDLPQALSLLRLACDSHDDNPELLCACGRYLIDASKRIDSVLEKGDCFQAARQYWERALALNPAHAASLLADAQFLIMMSFRNGDNPDKGLARLEEAATAGADPAAVAFYRGVAARSCHNEQEALAAFNQSLAHNPGFMPARLALMA